MNHERIQSVQSLSRVRLFVTPWIAARQASLSITNSWSSLVLKSIESVMPSSHLILSSPSPPAPNPSQHQSLFQWVNSLHEMAKVLEFQLIIIPSKEHPGKILPCSVLASCTAICCKIRGIFSSSLCFPLLFLPLPPTFASSFDSASIVYFSFKFEALFMVIFLNEKNIS